MADCTEYATSIGELAESLLKDEDFAADYFNEHGSDNYDAVVAEIQKRANGFEIARAEISQAWTEYRRSLADAKKKTKKGINQEIRRNAYDEEHKRKRGIDILNQILTGNFTLFKGRGRINKVSEAMKGLNAYIAELMDERAVPMRLIKRIEELGGHYEGTDITEAREIRDKLNRRNQLRKLLRERREKVASGDISTKPASDGKFADDPEVKGMKDELAALNKDLSEARLVKRLQESLAIIQERVINGAAKPDSPSFDRREDSEDLKAMRKELAQWRNREDVVTKLREYESMLRSGDFSAFTEAAEERKRKRAERTVSPDLQASMITINRLRRAIEEEIAFTGPISPWGHVKEAAQFARAARLSYDISGLGRQGAKALFSNPIIWGRSAAKTFASAWSEDNAAKIDAESRAMLPPGMEIVSGLYKHLHDIGGGVLHLTDGERIGVSRYVRALAQSNNRALRVFAKGIQVSDRLMATFLNRLRIELFMKAFRANEGNLTAEDLKHLANGIAIFTGRGQGLERHMQTASTVFLAPKWMLSQIQNAILLPTWSGLGVKDASGSIASRRSTARARKIAAVRYGRFLLSYGSMLAVAAMFADADDDDDVGVELDWRSSRLGMIKVNGNWYDFAGGLAKPIVLFGRTVTGQSKNSKGQISGIREPDSQIGFRKYKKNAFSGGDAVLLQYLRTSASPLVDIPASMLYGENAIGQRTTWKSNLESSLEPISFGQIVEAMEDEGASAKMINGVLSFVGVGVRREGGWEKTAKGPIQKIYEKAREE